MPGWLAFQEIPKRVGYIWGRIKVQHGWSVDCCDVLVSVELVNYWILEPVGIYHSSSHLRGNWLQSSAIVVGFLPIPGVQTNENFRGIPTEYDSSGALFVMEILDTSASGCHSLICSSASWCIYCSQSQFISFLVNSKYNF